MRVVRRGLKWIAQWRGMTDSLSAAGFCPLVFQVRGTGGTRWAADVPSAGP